MAHIQSQLKNADSNVRWETPDKFHITLKFLGEVDQSIIPNISSILSGVIKQFSCFEIVFDSLGAFPNPLTPRIIWLGIKADQTVLRLQTAIDNACASIGFEKEDRSFHPHCTIGRAKAGRNFPRLTEAIKTVTFEPMQFRCSEVHVMKSSLQQNGSLYTTLITFPL